MMTEIVLAAAMIVARPFPLGEVQLTGGVFLSRRNTDTTYLLEVVNVDRLLAEFRHIAGLPRKADRYPNRWEGGGINGHSLGHYLSAVSALYADTKNPAALAKVDYIVDELAACQRANGNGYVMTVPQNIYEDIRRGKVRASRFSLNGWWVPNYTLHKVFAGLRDAYRLAGNRKALEVARKLGDWYIGVVKDLPETTRQKILACEWGGLNETFCELYEDTGDRRYLEAAETYFDEKKFFDALAEGKDVLSNNLHANTQIPKIVGLAELYEQTGNERDRKVVSNFWDDVVNHRSFANGGHSDDEHFYRARYSVAKIGAHNSETCNINNMIKLTGHTFGWNPTAAQMDYVERGLWNQLLAQIGRKPGEFGYFLSQAPVAEKVFSTPEGAWWCCVGTGMENPMHYAEQVYYKGVRSKEQGASADVVYVNLFMPTRLNWKEKGIVIEQKTKFPKERGTTLIVKGPVNLRVRKPYWCAAMKVNGRAVQPEADGYVSIPKANGTYRIDLPMDWHVEPLFASGGSRIAFMYGPLVCVAITPPKAGEEDMAKRRWDDHLAAPGRTDESAPVITGRTDEERIAQFRKLKVMPLCAVYEEHYTVYFPTHQEDDARAKALAAITVDEIQPGFQQSEVNHDYAGAEAEDGTWSDRVYRHARGPKGFISYQMAVDPDKENTLLVTLTHEDHRRAFDVVVDAGEGAYTARIEVESGGKKDPLFYDHKVALPKTLTAGRNKVKITFRNPGAAGVVGGLYGLRMIKGE